MFLFADDTTSRAAAVLRASRREREVAARRGALFRADQFGVSAFGFPPAGGTYAPRPWADDGDAAAARRVLESAAGVFRDAVDALRASSRGAWCAGAEPELQASVGDFENCVLVDAGSAADAVLAAAPAVAVAAAVLRNASRHTRVVGAKLGRLKAGASVLPHAGTDNLRLRHLLTLRDGCGAGEGRGDRACVFLKAGDADAPRGYVEGRAMTFDDSFKHAVLSGPRHVETREALIVEVLHPQLCGNGPVCRARMRAADWANS